MNALFDSSSVGCTNASGSFTSSIVMVMMIANTASLKNISRSTSNSFFISFSISVFISIKLANCLTLANARRKRKLQFLDEIQTLCQYRNTALPDHDHWDHPGDHHF